MDELHSTIMRLWYLFLECLSLSVPTPSFTHDR